MAFRSLYFGRTRKINENRFSTDKSFRDDLQLSPEFNLKCSLNFSPKLHALSLPWTYPHYSSWTFLHIFPFSQPAWTLIYFLCFSCARFRQFHLRITAYSLLFASTGDTRGSRWECTMFHSDDDRAQNWIYNEHRMAAVSREWHATSSFRNENLSPSTSRSRSQTTEIIIAKRSSRTWISK